jgi:hypothetical protein
VFESVLLRRQNLSVAGIDLNWEQSFRVECVGDPLLLGQAGRGHDADLVRAMAVGLFHRRRIDPPRPASNVAASLGCAFTRLPVSSSLPKRLVSLKVDVAFDADPERALVLFELGNPHAAEFGLAHAKIAKAEGDIVVFGIEFGEQPRRGAAGTEQLYNRLEVDGVAVLRRDDLVCLAVPKHFLFEFVWNEGHMFFLSSLVLARAKPR